MGVVAAGVGSLYSTGLIVVVVGVLIVGWSLLSRQFRKVTGPADDAYTLGYQIGYDRGYLEGHATARPTVVTIDGEAVEEPIEPVRPVAPSGWWSWRRPVVVISLGVMAAVMVTGVVIAVAATPPSHVSPKAKAKTVTPALRVPSTVRAPSVQHQSTTKIHLPRATPAATIGGLPRATIPVATLVRPAVRGPATPSSHGAIVPVPIGAPTALFHVAVPAVPAAPPAVAAVPLTAAQQTALDAANAAALTAANAAAAAEATRVAAAAAAAATKAQAAHDAYCVANPTAC